MINNTSIEIYNNNVLCIHNKYTDEYSITTLLL